MPNTREKLIELLEKSPYLDVLGGYLDYETAADHLIANGVTIPVRCDDCKHYRTSGCAMDTYAFDVVEEGFCSYGERRNDADNH